MKGPGKIQITVWLLGLGGAALFTFLLIRQGASQVGMAFATARWALAAVVIYHFVVPVVLDATAWWVLFPKSDRLPLRKLLWMRWIGESVSTLVPSAAVGGDIVRARLASINGTSVPVAAGTVLVDVTLGVFTQAAFTVLGLACRCNWTEKFRSSNFGRNARRCSRCCGFLLRATAGNVPFPRSRHSAPGEFAGVAFAGAGRRDARSDRSHALRPAACTSDVLRVDDYFAGRWVRRNLDRTLCARSSRDIR